MKSNSLTALALALACTAGHATVWKPLWPWHPRFPEPVDHWHYLYMSVGQNLHIKPYCWRVAVPWLAGIWPGLEAHAFAAIAIASIVLAGYLLYRLGGYLPMLVFYASPWAAHMPLWDFWLPDAACLLAVTLSIYLIRSGMVTAAVVLAPLAVLIKEPGCLIAPLIFGLTGRVKPAFVSAVLIGLVSVYVRLMIPSHNGDPAWIATMPEELQTAWPVLRPYKLTTILAHYETLSNIYSLRDVLVSAGAAFVLLWMAGRRAALAASPALLTILLMSLFVGNVERVWAFAVPIAGGVYTWKRSSSSSPAS